MGEKQKGFFIDPTGSSFHLRPQAGDKMIKRRPEKKPRRKGTTPWQEVMGHRRILEANENNPEGEQKKLPVLSEKAVRLYYKLYKHRPEGQPLIRESQSAPPVKKPEPFKPIPGVHVQHDCKNPFPTPQEIRENGPAIQKMAQTAKRALSKPG